MEQQDHSQQLQQTLRRIYNDNYHQQPFNEDYSEMDNIHYDDNNDDNNNDDDDDDEQLDDNHDQILSRTELIQLSQLLSEGGGNEEVLESLLSSPRIQMALQKALQDEELQPYLIVPWHPWWMPDFAAKLHPNNNHHYELDRLGDATVIAAVVATTTTTITSVSDNADDDDDESTPPSPTLDDRLLQIPPLSTLIKNTLPSPLLVYNLLDVLYSIVRTLRLYNGVDDAMSVATEAVTAVLIPSSVVLSYDARYTSVAHVLTECTRSSTSALRQAGSSRHVGLCNTPWTVLVEDVAILVCNGRFVARALLEAIDLIQAAIMSADYDHHSNKNNKRKKQSKQRRNENRSLPLKPCLKKLEYYLSWSRHVFTAGSMSMDASLLVAEIRSWARDWSAPPEGNSN